jgi:signal transduction histidine kinase
MDISNFVSVQYCFSYLVDQIPIGLLLYSHIPTALIALIFGGFVFARARTLSSALLFGICFCFAIWCFFDLVSWFAFLGSSTVMFTWSLLDLVGLLMFFFAYYFLYIFVTKKPLPRWQKILAFVVILPQIAITLLGLNLTGYDANACEATESELLTKYVYIIEALFILAAVTFTTVSWVKIKDRAHKRETLLVGIGVNIFLIFFFSATFAVSILAEGAASLYAYNYEIYGLFGMPILLIYLGYLIVRYKAFDLRIFGAQALVFSLLAVLASEFAFVSSLANRILVSITLVLTGFIGIVLIRSVRREISQRERIELLAKDLEQANKQQVALIHFITHQLKGFVAKSRNIFAMIQEGDYGKVPATMKPMIDEGFNSATKGAQTIQDILNASNIKSGKVSMAMTPFDFKALVESIVNTLKPNADAKGIALTLTKSEDSITVTGDQMQLENAIKNLVDNTIKYTPQGSVNISLTKENNIVRFVTQDTGVGITAEDMQHLFTEGGHGKNSQKINVDSTGFGLYIVKSIIEAHKGKVWAESEGAGKGSKFTVELPI